MLHDSTSEFGLSFRKYRRLGFFKCGPQGKTGQTRKSHDRTAGRVVVACRFVIQCDPGAGERVVERGHQTLNGEGLAQKDNSRPLTLTRLDAIPRKAADDDDGQA